MKINSGLLSALSLIAATLLISLSLFSFTEADRSTERRTVVRAMCTNDMFYQNLVFNQASSTRSRTVTVSCPSAVGAPGFDTSDGFLHVGDYYFNTSSNKYIAYVGAAVAATSTRENFVCIGPHTVISESEPVGMRKVNVIGTAYWQRCSLNGSEVYVTISAAEHEALLTGHGFPDLTIDPNRPTSCRYSSVIQNTSPRRR